MSLGAELAELYARDLTRLAQELAAFSDPVLLWQTVPGVSNSAGNLALHLEGNLREYIGRQIGGIAFERQRDQEFARRDVPLENLLARIAELQRTIPAVIESISGTDLERPFPEIVFERPLSTAQFVIHLHGHFNYHLGQIDYLRRVLTGAGAVKLAQL